MSVVPDKSICVYLCVCNVRISEFPDILGFCLFEFPDVRMSVSVSLNSRMSLVPSVCLSVCVSVYLSLSLQKLTNNVLANGLNSVAFQFLLIQSEHDAATSFRDDESPATVAANELDCVTQMGFSI